MRQHVKPTFAKRALYSKRLVLESTSQRRHDKTSAKCQRPTCAMKQPMWSKRNIDVTHTVAAKGQL